MSALRKGVATRTHVLALRETFQIARGAADEETVVAAELEHDGIVARGEGAPVDYWGETPEGITAALEADGAALLGDDLFAGEAISTRIAAWDGPQGAKMALDGALHDWLGRRVGQPRAPAARHRPGDAADLVHDRHRHRRGDGRPDAPRDRLRGAQDQGRRPGRSRAPAGRAREVTAARLRIDGNEGWDLATARELTPELIELGVEFVEQPFPAADLDAFHALPRAVAAAAGADRRGLQGPGLGRRRSPTYADGIVIKLSKCGGIREALRMIHAARALGLQVMLGCMIESELGIAQAAQLGSLADHIDLDGHLLISSRPFSGLGLHDGRLVLSDGPGLGVEPAGG